MQQMPAPIASEPAAKRLIESEPRLATASAIADTATAAIHERNVNSLVYPSTMGNEKASMPTKCMDQMPVPIAIEPPIHHDNATPRSLLRTRLARSSVTYDAKLATMTEAATTHKS